MRGADDVPQPIPHACLAPSIEAIVAGGARPLALAQVSPRRGGSQHLEDAAQHAATTGELRRLMGQQWLDHAPLEASQVISAHADPELAFDARRTASSSISRRLLQFGIDT
jgi:hypothetical protein